MTFLGRINFITLTAAALVAVNGCSPTAQGQLDDEKEPHFGLGKSRINQMDYHGAVEAFQEALEVNPRSAAAHFQLAWLFEAKESDPAAAIYHYQQYLKFDPAARNAEVIRQRIESCKQQLAANVLPPPSAPAAQRQLEDLADKNRQLQSEVEKWRAYYAAQSAALKANPSGTPNNPAPQPSSGSPIPDDMSQAAPAATAAVTPAKPAPARVSPARTHTVLAGETLAAIARKHNLNLAAVQAANPGVSPKKMRVGQVLNLPPP